MYQARFRDRIEAGRRLAEALKPYAGRPNLLVLALPRGGVPVGYEVARALHAPLDLILVRKLGVPGHEELAMGAIASGGIRIVSEDVIAMLGIPDRMIATVAAAEEKELERRERLYRDARAAPRCERLPQRSGSKVRNGWLWPCRSLHLRLARRSAPKRMTWSARSLPNRSWPSAPGTRISPRPVTRRSGHSFGAPRRNR
jgi:hypothetical protein